MIVEESAWLPTSGNEVVVEECSEDIDISKIYFISLEEATDGPLGVSARDRTSVTEAIAR